MMLTQSSSRAAPVRVPQQQIETYQGVAGGRYHLIDTRPKWKEVFEKLRIKKYLACDTETSGLSHLSSHIVGLSFSYGAEDSFYIPVRHMKLIPDPTTENPKKPKWLEVSSDEKQLSMEMLFDDLKEIYENSDRITIWHNFKYDGHFLRDEGFNVQGIVHDTMLMHNLIDENTSSKLKDLATAFVDIDAAKWEVALDDFRTKFARAHKMQKKNVHYGLIPLKIMAPYAASDAHYTWAMFKRFQPKIVSDKSLRELYVNIESRLLHVLLDMEHKGVVVDRKYLKRISPEMSDQLEELKKVVWKNLGEEINIESNIQVIPLLQAKGVKFYKRTKGGKPSLDKEVLESIASKHQVAADLQAFRETRKLKTTYVDNLIVMSSTDQKIHCEYNQNVSTGRMSSHRPNLTNIPRVDTTIRSAFVPPTRITCPCGYTDDLVIAPKTCPKCGENIIVDNNLFMLLIDYSQIEVRLCAHYSEDPILLDVYNNTGEDVHLRTCCEMFGYNYKEAAKILEDKNHPKYGEIKKYRQIAKMINFLIIYGGGAKNLAVKISTPQEVFTEEQCKAFIKQYFDKYRGISRWIAKTKIQAQRDMFVQNWFGRYRRLPELKDAARRKFLSEEKWKIERALRQACNYLIQGCKDADSHVLTIEGNKTIAHLYQNPCPIITHTGQTENYIVHDTGVKPVFEVETTHGTEKVTKDHVFFVYQQGDLAPRRLENIKVGDFIVAQDLVSLDWACVRRIEPIGVRPTMDIEIFGEDHSYIGNGLLQHNSAADLFKIALIRVNDILKGSKSRLVMPIHDELIFYFHKSDMGLLPKIKKDMEDFNFKVPIVADISYTTTSWTDKKELKL